MAASAAIDRSLPRLALLRETVRRLGYPEIRPVAGDLGARRSRRAASTGSSSTRRAAGPGTLRKTPRDPVSPHAVGDRAPGSASSRRRSGARPASSAPGGYLLYSTCSLEEEENEAVVARVLAREPGLRRAPIEGSGDLPATAAGGVRLFPDESTDGFTAHLLRRASA